MSDQDAKPKADDAESLSTAGLERGFDDHWALVRHGNPALAANVFAEALARAAWDAATTAEREACAKVCEHLWQEEAEAAVNGTQEPKYHDAIECAYAIRLRSNVELRGGPAVSSPERPA